MKASEEKTGIRRTWGWWVALVVVLLIGIALGRASVDSEIDEAVLGAASIIDDMADSMEIAGQAQSAEQEHYRLWVKMIDTEREAIAGLKAEFPSVSVELNSALETAEDSREWAVVAGELSKSYWEASEREAVRLRNLAETIRDLVD